MLPRLQFFFLSTLLLNSYFLIFTSASAADTTPPVTQASLNPSAPDGSHGWYKSPVEVTLSSSDDSSGVASINWNLDNSSWQTQNFSGTLNLAANPSFEQVSGGSPVAWNFVGQPGSSGASDNTVYLSGNYSIKVVSVQNGWSGFNDQNNYIPVHPFDNLTASVWIKTQSVSGTGAYFKVWALGSSGASLLASSAQVTGTSNGFVRISKSFNVSSSDAYGVYLDLGLFGAGTVWFDAVAVEAVATDTRVIQTFAAPGSHVLQFYAVDFSGNRENSQSVSFKIDSTAPSNWRGFETTRQGNDHTLVSEIEVDDSVSQPDPSSVQFQYSIDGGQTWGYYSNLQNCSSTWNADGWSNSLTTQSENSGKTLEIITSPVDYCSSNWQICKIIRFRLNDLAGNQASKEICINGSWFQASGDVGSNYAITMNAAGAASNTDGVVISKNQITNFSSGNNWQLINYGLLTFGNYSGWLSQFPTSAPLPSGKLPAVSGRYLVNSSYTISSTTIPTNFSGSNFSAVVFINGDLTVSNDLSLGSQSAILFVVAGDVKVDKQVQNLAASFLIDGNFDSSYNGNKGTPLVVNGSVLANTLSLDRSLSPNSQSTAAEQIYERPSNFFLLNSQFGQSTTSWREVLP